MIFKNHFQKSF